MVPVTVEKLKAIISNLRPADREEIFATLHPFDDELADDDLLAEMTAHAANSAGVGWIAEWDGEPLAAIGLTFMWPGVASAWMFAACHWNPVSFGLTRWSRRNMIPLMKGLGLHRCQCWSLASHDAAHTWLRALGAREEAVAPGFGRDGSTFHLFSWVAGRDF